MNKKLIILSQLSGEGPTGVETHFNQILESAKSRGLETVLITPQSGAVIERKLTNILSKLIAITQNSETKILWSRKIQYLRFKKQLTDELNKSKSKKITVYAQDPLTAYAAIEVRSKLELKFSVISVVHFNISEAQEIIEKGIGKPGGNLWKFLMQTEEKSLPYVDKIIFVSDFMMGIVSKRMPRIETTKKIVIPNFPAKPKIDAHRDAISGDLITIGTLEPRKNQSFLLYIINECNNLGKKYSLNIIGDGPDRKKLEAIAKELNIDSQIKFHGFKKNASSYISKHKVLVHSSKMESQGIALVEALSYGRPIVAAPVGGIPEVFSDGIEGLYWDLNDVKKSAESLILLLENNQLLLKLGNAAFEKYKNSFDTTKLADRWIHELTNTLKDS